MPLSYAMKPLKIVYELHRNSRLPRPPASEYITAKVQEVHIRIYSRHKEKNNTVLWKLFRHLNTFRDLRTLRVYFYSVVDGRKSMGLPCAGNVNWHYT